MVAILGQCLDLMLSLIFILLMCSLGLVWLICVNISQFASVAMLLCACTPDIEGFVWFNLIQSLFTSLFINVCLNSVNFVWFCVIPYDRAVSFICKIVFCSLVSLLHACLLTPRMMVNILNIA